MWERHDLEMAVMWSDKRVWVKDDYQITNIVVYTQYVSLSILKSWLGKPRYG